MTEAINKILIETATELSGYAQRHFMAKVVKELMNGNVRLAARELGWHRKTLRKALAEWEGQFCYIDRFFERGRKPLETQRPMLLEDIRQIADAASQTDATFHTTQLYTRLSAAAVRQQLIDQKGYAPEEVPCEDTIRRSSMLWAIG